ncbi:MAG: DUF4136 domain-containing protein [Cyclobacteriaceae bacterium]|nr:DUF4136 domain-containing protein [Cyclobacteriaceae bacterium]
MKKEQLVFLLIAGIFSGCLGYKELPVEYDYSYKGQFKKYRTFEIMKPVGLDDGTLINEQIEASIISRMKFLGYRQTSNKPHLLINFKLFEDSLGFTGYTQPEIEEWIKTQNENLPYERKKFDLNTGTLLIQFFDRRQNRSVWQGYATTLYGKIDSNNQRHLRNAVISILDKYRFWAEGFMEGTASTDTEL